jgi:ketosteroid isomerase-like protein
VSKADVELVRHVVELWQQNEREQAWAGWAEDATMNAPKEWPEAASSKGLDEVRAVFNGFDDAFGPEWPTDLTVARVEDVGGGRVLVEYDWMASGASSGASVFQEIAGIYHVTDGRVTHADFFISHDEGRKAAGID